MERTRSVVKCTEEKNYYGQKNNANKLYNRLENKICPDKN